MTKGKYALRAANKRAQDAENRITELDAQVAALKHAVEVLTKENKAIGPLQDALHLARKEALEVTSPKVRELESKNARLRRRVHDIDRSQKSRQRLFQLAVNLLAEKEGMTHFEAAEEVARRGIYPDSDVTLAFGSERKMGAKAARSYQRAKGWRRKKRGSDGENQRPTTQGVPDEPPPAA